MDPLSILGAALGVISLVLQVVDECVKGYKLYQDATNLPEAYSYLHLRIHLEEQRFLNFALGAGILHEEGVLCSTLHVNRTILLATLAEIKGLLEQFAARNGRYQELSTNVTVNWDDAYEVEQESSALLRLPSSAQKTERPVKDVCQFSERVRQTGKRLRTIVYEPKRLIWATVDKETFEELLSKLENLNSFLLSLLDSSQNRQLQETMDTTYLEILQLRNDVGSLKVLLKALTLAPATAQSTSSDGSILNDTDLLAQAVGEEKSIQAKQKTYMQTLVEIKIRNISLNEHNADQGHNSGTQLDLNDITCPRLDESLAARESRVDATYRGRSVWLEWRDLSDPSADTRIALLTDFLHFAKPEGFRAPPCLGYVKYPNNDPSESSHVRFGIVFEKPRLVKLESKVTTLRELLDQLPAPSLSARVSLCAIISRGVYSFHAVDWLHKALRSDSVIFCSDPLDLRDPFITGFEFSRPSIFSNYSAKPAFDPSKDIYRHPRAQSSQSGRYRKSYDVYSLGVLILEVMQWQPVDKLVGIENVSSVRPPLPLGMKSILLGETPTDGGSIKRLRKVLPLVALTCGDAICAVVERCLRSEEVERKQYPEETQDSIALRLRNVLEEDIVKKLDRIAEVL